MAKIEMVFVHLGSGIPNYLISNLNYCSITFPERDVILITNVDCDSIRVNSRVKVWRYSPNQEVISRFTSESSLNPAFRNGFWVYTKLRFLALAKYVSEAKTSIVHIESDVWIAPYFDFAYFETLRHDLAFPLVDQKRGVASTLFIRGNNGAKILTDVTLSSKDGTDMQILNNIFSIYGSKVFTLPSTYPLEQQPVVCPGTNDFIFDGIAIGMYLFGDDSRNSFGLSRRFMDYPNTSISLSSSEFRLVDGVLEIRIDSSWRKVQSLHVHSKTKVLFSSQYAKWLSNAILLSKFGPRREFHFWGFARCLVDYARLLIGKMSVNAFDLY